MKTSARSVRKPTRSDSRAGGKAEKSGMNTLRNGLRVLRVLSELDRPLGVTDLGRRLSLDKGTVHRLLAALLDDGFVEKDVDTRRYLLGMGIVDIAVSRLRESSVTACALSYMEGLRNRLKETIALMVPDGRKMACALVCESQQPIRLGFNIGERIPIHRTASGFAWLSTQPESDYRRLILASIGREELPSGLTLEKIVSEVRKAKTNGYAISKYYRPEGGGIASAILDGSGRCVAALTLAALTENLQPPRDSEVGRILRSTAARIAADLSGRRKPSVKRII
jgi:DNA-binding IclR family transcriptional regulator